MGDIDILKQIIKTTAQEPFNAAGRTVSVKLGEPQSDYSITICGIPADAIIIKVDKFKSPDSIFNSSKGECRRADYVIVANTGSQKRILYIEMKKGKKPDTDIKQQLYGAKCFMCYCQEIGKNFWQEKDFLKEYSDRFISIANISTNKQTTRIPTGDVHDTPEKMLKIRRPGALQFNRLADIK